MKRMDSVCLDIINIYRDITKTKNFVNVFVPGNGSEFENQIVDEIIDKHSNKSKGVFPISHEQIEYKGIVPYHVYPFVGNDKRDRKTYKKLQSRNKTGLFKITFSDKSILLVARWFEGFGRNEVVQNIVVGERSTYSSYLRALDTQIKLNQKPKTGIFRANMTQFGLMYSDVKDLPSSPVIHPKLDELKKDIKYYFDNVNIFTRFKQSGVRKFMLISEPGTGKSSMFYKIAAMYGKEKSVVFATDIDSAAAHLSKCAKHKVSTIIFLEDADTALGGPVTHASILNFLDGVDTPYNPNGSLILMSTNFPERIEERILTRPGRIDKIFNIDALFGSWAVDCADLYFSEFFSVKRNKSKIEPIVSGMTGAQIKELALTCMSYAASNERTIDIPLIAEVKENFAKNISDAYKFSDKSSLKKLKGNNIGFTVE